MDKVELKPTTTAERRKARLAEALRGNLARRKVRSRAAKADQDIDIKSDGEAGEKTTGPVTDFDVGKEL